MSDAAPCGRPAVEPAWTRWLPVLLVPAALLPDVAAAVPLRTYFFRDFTVTFLPLRLFAARELRRGQVPFWNPYLFEGTFQLPSLYPADLLHALWPDPVFVSWLLTMHLPLAAVATYWLARELGGSRQGAFLAGLAFALGGFALSCLNLYVFLQALALAPFVIGLLRRTAGSGTRPLAAAAAVTALATSTLAVEFVAQAVAAGLLLAFVEGRRRGLGRGLVAVGLGAGLAGIPLAVTVGLLPETARGAGFSLAIALANAVHPLVLVQTLMPHLFGIPSAPAEAWWGGQFFSKGLPYFLSLYVGPLLLGLAALGVGGFERRTRAVLLGLAGAALWYSLGERGGIAALLQGLPLASAFRFPSKALLLPHLVTTLAAGRGLDRVREDVRRLLPGLAALVSGLALMSLAVPAAMQAAPERLASWAGVPASQWPQVVGVALLDAGGCALVALSVALVAVLARRGMLGPQLAAAFLIAVVLADLSRAGVGLNRQVDRSFFAPLPELAALPVRDPAGGRVFSYGTDHSPAFRRFLSSGVQDLTLAGTFVDRQVLGPFTNVIDGLEAAEAQDLTAFAPRPRELEAELYAPSEAGRLVPWLRNASVSRVLSLDRLEDAGLRPLAEIPAGPRALWIHAYAVQDTWPRAYVGCRVIVESDRERASLLPYRRGFDPASDVALGSPAAAGCRTGAARVAGAASGREAYEVQSDGPGWLVVRASFARGWTARVDGRPAPVVPANGKHRAVPVAAGQHHVVLSYRPAGLGAGLILSAASLLVCVALALAGGGRR